jgi:hypothetical protein
MELPSEEMMYEDGYFQESQVNLVAHLHETWGWIILCDLIIANHWLLFCVRETNLRCILYLLNFFLGRIFLFQFKSCSLQYFPGPYRCLVENDGFGAYQMVSLCLYTIILVSLNYIGAICIIFPLHLNVNR